MRTFTRMLIFKYLLRAKNENATIGKLKKHDKVLSNDLIVFQFMLDGGKVKIVYTPQSCFYKVLYLTICIYKKIIMTLSAWSTCYIFLCCAFLDSRINVYYY